MTHREVGQYVTAVQARREAEFKERAILLDGLFRQWAATQAKHPRVLGPRQLYPDLFRETRPQAPAARAQLAAQRWRQFLGV